MIVMPISIRSKYGIASFFLFFLLDCYTTLWQGLAALGLKTGGTVQQRAERLFLTKVVLNCLFVRYRMSVVNLR